MQAKGRTVQGDIERALSEIFPNQKITLIGSGRTDSGVHALGQVANIHLQSSMAPSILQRALNSKLNKDVRISGCTQVHDDFNARFSAASRTYVYKISKQLPPFTQRLHWSVKYNLEPLIIMEYTRMIMGKCDLTAFCKADHKQWLVTER